MSYPIEQFGLRPTQVYDSYWSFAAKRQALYWARLERSNQIPDYDPIIAQHRFTNAYRALDRISQYLIAVVQRAPEAPLDARDQAFRTLLFKIFNRIDTWEFLETEFGVLRWEGFDFEAAARVLEKRRSSGFPIYSAAYIMPSPKLGYDRKHENHLALLKSFLEGREAGTLLNCKTLRDAYDVLIGLPGVGRFLAFQFAIDLGYSDTFAFDESDFVVAGPGARDGIAKCFVNWRQFALEDIIMAVHEVQEEEFALRALSFRPIPNRTLQPVDCQNLFCEVSKYARLAHPDVRGTDGRQRIKQRYSPSPRPLQPPVLPVHWQSAQSAVR